MKRLLIIGAVALATTASFCEVIYENDFATRTSKGAIPCGEWREVLYSTGAFLNDDYDAPFNGTAAQDNWIRGNNASDSPALIVDDGGNQEAVICGDVGVDRHAILKHRIGNTFTSGMVTVQCDFRAPSNWTGYGPEYGIRFYVGGEGFFSPQTSKNDYPGLAAAYAGIVVDGGQRKFSRIGSVKVAGANDTSWYRIVMAIDLDHKTWSESWYDLGASHPTLDTATPATSIHSEDNIAFSSTAVAEVSAIGIACYTPHGGSDASNLADTGQFDNIRVSHNGVECYVNDFTARRSRGIGGALSGTYVALTPVTNVFSYTSVTQLVAAKDATLQVQPVGFDGWRRLKKTQSGNLSIYSNSDHTQGDAVARTSDDVNLYSFSGHPIGQKFTSGKVRIAADCRMTALMDGGYARIVLGNDVLYGGDFDTYLTGRVADAGIAGDKTSDGNRKVVYYSSSGEAVLPGDGVWGGYWCRFIITANLDAGTYDFAICQQSAPSPNNNTHPAFGSADGNILYSRTGIPFVNPLDSISCLAVAGEGVIMLVDNICVWHMPSGESEATLVYSNDFTTRRVYGCEGNLIGTLMRDPVGMDGWVRESRTSDKFLLVGGSNAAVGFGAAVDNLNSAYATHDIGGSYQSGKMVAQFDMRAPSSWSGSYGCAFVWLGGDEYHEGNLRNSREFYKAAACGAGFDQNTFAAYDGNRSGGGSWQTSGTAMAGHWYRFVVKAEIDAGTSDVEVFDMGLTQPTLATRTPKTDAVATFTGKGFRKALPRLTCVGIQVRGAALSQSLGSHRLLVDNIRIDYHRNGFVIIIK